MSGPVKASNLDAALAATDGDDESKSGEKVVSTIVGSYEEYLTSRGYEPWRTKTEHTWPTFNKNKFISCAPSFLYKGNNKPAAGSAPKGTIVDGSVKRVVDGENQDVKIRTITVGGTNAAPGTLVWCNPNREIGANGMAKDTYKGPPGGGSRLQNEDDALEMELFRVVSTEEIEKVDFQLRGGLLFWWLAYEMRYQKHTYNWGLGSSFRDTCIIWSCFFTLWGFTGLLFYFLLLAHLEGGDSANNLWMYAFCMAVGWIVIGITLHARGVVVAREAAKAEEEAA